jgi:hypothetical protein
LSAGSPKTTAWSQSSPHEPPRHPLALAAVAVVPVQVVPAGPSRSKGYRRPPRVVLHSRPWSARVVGPDAHRGVVGGPRQSSSTWLQTSVRPGFTVAAPSLQSPPRVHHLGSLRPAQATGGAGVPVPVPSRRRRVPAAVDPGDPYAVAVVVLAVADFSRPVVDGRVPRRSRPVATRDTRPSRARHWPVVDDPVPSPSASRSRNASGEFSGP